MFRFAEMSQTPHTIELGSVSEVYAHGRSKVVTRFGRCVHSRLRARNGDRHLRLRLRSQSPFR